MTGRDQLLDAMLRDVLAERAAEVVRQAIDDAAMVERLLPILARPSGLSRAEVRTAMRVLLLAAALVALLGIVAFVAAPRPKPLGNGPITWANGATLMAADPAGGHATTLGQGPAVESGTRCCSLAWSPDGSRLAAVSDTELIVVDPNGRRTVPRPGLQAGGVPAWSPDGTRLAVAAIDHNATHVFVVDLRDGSARRIDGDLAASDGPAWSPDGRSVAFGGAATETPLAQQGAPGTDVWSLYVGPADASADPHLVAGGLPAAWFDLKQVLMSQAPDWASSWSPDGSRIAFEAKTATCCGYRVYVVPAAGGSARAVTPDSVIATNPIWSPDGTRLAYSSWPPRLQPPVDLVVVSVPDGAAGAPVGKPVVVAHDIDPWDVAWSPDGRWLAYGHGESGQIATAQQRFADIRIVRPDGTESAVVATGPFEGGLAWQPVPR